MAVKRRASRLSPEKRTAEIIAAARQVFSERGYQETIVAEIAQRAGVVEGSIYRYFKNKRDLMFRTAEDWFEEMISEDRGAQRAVKGSANKLRFIIHRHLVSIYEEPALSRLVFQHLRPDPDYRNTRLFELNRAYTARVTDVIVEGIKQGEIRRDVQPALVRDLIFGSIEHRTWAFLREEGDYDPDELADQIVDLIWIGLQADRPESDLSPLITRLENALDGFDNRK